MLAVYESHPVRKESVASPWNLEPNTIDMITPVVDQTRLPFLPARVHVHTAVNNNNKTTTRVFIKSDIKSDRRNHPKPELSQKKATTQQHCSPFWFAPTFCSIDESYWPGPVTAILCLFDNRVLGYNKTILGHIDMVRTTRPTCHNCLIEKTL